MTDPKDRQFLRHPLSLIREIENLKREIARSKEVLAASMPDTFLGRSDREAIVLRNEDGDLKRAVFDRHGTPAFRPDRLDGNRATLANLLSVLVHAAVEQTEGRARAAFYLADNQGTTLHHITGMTQDYARYVDGFAISPGSLACGLAAATRHAVITSDVIEDPSWERWRWLASQFGYRACWSFPIETTDGKVLGTFAMYHAEPRTAESRDLELASLLTRTAAKIMSETLAG